MRQETRAGSEKLARLAVAALESEVALLPNSHRRAGFVVLKAPDVPSALVEMGFLSHPQDEAALNKRGAPGPGGGGAGGDGARLPRRARPGPGRARADSP